MHLSVMLSAESLCYVEWVHLKKWHIDITFSGVHPLIILHCQSYHRELCSMNTLAVHELELSYLIKSFITITPYFSTQTSCQTSHQMIWGPRYLWSIHYLLLHVLQYCYFWLQFLPRVYHQCADGPAWYATRSYPVSANLPSAAWWEQDPLGGVRLSVPGDVRNDRVDGRQAEGTGEGSTGTKCRQCTQEKYAFVLHIVNICCFIA